MGDQEKFETFKQQLVEDNEKRYGREARAQYGDEAVDSSIRKVQGMSKAQFDQFNSLSAELMATLSAAFKTGDPAGELAQKAADLHRQWLSYFWDNYSPAAHRGVAQMYVDDERFTAYYDSIQLGTAAFLRDAINIYADQLSS
ncbi:MAG: TipAS antibiotic-recognition domain-containing protein [Syntrophomonadaceae bacterium]